MSIAPPAPTEGSRSASSFAAKGLDPRRRPTPRFHELGDFATVDRRTLVLMGLAVPIGVVSAFIAAALYGLIGLFTNLFYYQRVSVSFVSPAGNALGWLSVGVPVLGGLIVGGMALWGSERIRGHGIPEALESILVRKSKIEPRMVVLKPLSAAISIGSGGPFGAEGPIIMTGGSLGSVFGQTLHLSAAERKVLLVAGAAGGMAATFNTPMAAVLLAVELLLFEWKPRSLLPVAVASTVATLTRWVIFGDAPLFPLPASPLPDLPIAGGAVLIGLSAGALATVLTLAVYRFEDLFRRAPVHWAWWPAIGGLTVGVGGVIDPRALGVGYTSIDLLLLGGLGVVATATLLVVKGVIWSASLGSGTSGGVLAPLLMMGASMGVLWGNVLPFGTVSLWALVAMGAILGGTMRAPFTGVVFSLELTHDLNVIFPLLIAAVAAEAVTVFTLPRSILTEKVARRHVHVSREYAVDPLEIIPVGAVMHTDVWTVPATSTVAAVAKRGTATTERYVGYTLVGPGGEPQGFVTKEGLVAFLAEGGDPERPVRHLARPLEGLLFPDHPCRVGAALLAELDVETLPVVDPAKPRSVVGLFSRESLFEARVQAMQEELERDRVIKVSFPRLRIGDRLLSRPDPSPGHRGEAPGPDAEPGTDGSGSE